jgi:hypothetical protein
MHKICLIFPLKAQINKKKMHLQYLWPRLAAEFQSEPGHFHNRFATALNFRLQILQQFS